MIRIRQELFGIPSIIPFLLDTTGTLFAEWDKSTCDKSIHSTTWTWNILLGFQKTSGICSNVPQMPDASTLPFPKADGLIAEILYQITRQELQCSCTVSSLLSGLSMNSMAKVGNWAIAPWEARDKFEKAKELAKPKAICSFQEESEKHHIIVLWNSEINASQKNQNSSTLDSQWPHHFCNFSLFSEVDFQWASRFLNFAFFINLLTPDKKERS